MIAPTYASTGPLPSGRSMTAVPREEMQRSYYRTASMQDLSWKTPSADDRGENFLDIHNIGRRTTKYMEYQKSTAPLLDRNTCNYSRDFVPLPVNDCKVNRMLANSFKTGMGAGMKTSMAPFDARSLHEDTFTLLTREEQKRSVLPRAPARWLERTQTLGGSGIMTETRSHAHLNYPVPFRELAKVRSVNQPKPCLELPGTVMGGFSPKTSYQELGQKCLQQSRSSPQLGVPGAGP